MSGVPDLDARVLRRLKPHLEAALSEQSDAVRDAFLTSCLATVQVEQGEDGAGLFVAVLLAGRPVLKADARVAGLFEVGDRVFYHPDVVFDDDLPGEAIPL